MSLPRKRKYRDRQNKLPGNNMSVNFSAFEGNESSPDPILYIQAHEADIIRGPPAVTAAMSLEANNRIQDNNETSDRAKYGDPLILWTSASHSTSQPLFPGDEDDVQPKTANKTLDEPRPAIWVDRYDARLLLDVLPSAPTVVTTETSPVPGSPGGWSDLPSDNEDVFFFSPEEAEDLRREKKRRHLEQLREERLRAIRAEDDDIYAEEDKDIWGGSDEEPDDTQKDLMRRTALHLLSSPNTAQLEMRILANHGSDHRFAFLRGRWSRAWKVAKEGVKLEKEEKEKEVAAKPFGVLVGYGDSDVDSGEGSPDEKESVDDTQADMHSTVVPLSQKTEDAAKEARRARAKEWAQQRRQQTQLDNTARA